jgi:hypothetical protein
MMSDASPSLAAARCSPLALMILPASRARLRLDVPSPAACSREAGCSELDQGDFDPPLSGGAIEDHADVLVDPIGLFQDLVKCVLIDDVAKRGLGDLVDRCADVLDRVHGPHGSTTGEGPSEQRCCRSSQFVQPGQHGLLVAATPLDVVMPTPRGRAHKRPEVELLERRGRDT